MAANSLPATRVPSRAARYEAATRCTAGPLDKDLEPRLAEVAFPEGGLQLKRQMVHKELKWIRDFTPVINRLAEARSRALSRRATKWRTDISVHAFHALHIRQQTWGCSERRLLPQSHTDDKCDWENDPESDHHAAMALAQGENH